MCNIRRLSLCIQKMSFYLIIVLLLKTYMYVCVSLLWVMECIYTCMAKVILFNNSSYIYFNNCVNGLQLEISLTDIIIT
jgi:hypothetical protein